MGRTRLITSILPLIAWMGVIFFFSSQSYEQQSIQPFLRNNIPVEQLKEKIPDVTIKYRSNEINAKQAPFQFIELLFRKGAHLFVYAVLAVLTFTAFSLTKLNYFLKGMLVLLLALTVAIMDEWNQSTSAMRTGAIQDIGIDLIGACIGLIFIIVVSRFKRL